jgi:hypothetical protein
VKLQQTAKHRAHAHKQLGQAVEGVLSGLAAVEARLVSLARTSAHFDGSKPWVTALLGANAPAAAQAERLREVLDRDRALVSAGPPRHVQAEHKALAAPAPVAKVSARAPICDEPIRTRTMARLLAGQGHQARALSIYDYLLARADADEGLRAEAELLRSQNAAAPSENTASVD